MSECKTCVKIFIFFCFKPCFLSKTTFLPFSHKNLVGPAMPCYPAASPPWSAERSKTHVGIPSTLAKGFHDQNLLPTSRLCVHVNIHNLDLSGTDKRWALRKIYSSLKAVLCCCGARNIHLNKMTWCHILFVQKKTGYEFLHRYQGERVQWTPWQQSARPV